MKLIAAIALLSAGACAATPDDDTAGTWPCAARRGDVHTSFVYDEYDRVVHERSTRGDALVRETLTAYQGPTVVRTEAREADAEGDLTVSVTERDLTEARITGVRFTSTYFMGYRETWSYLDGALSEVDGVLDDGRTFSREYFRPDGNTVAITECDPFSTTCALRIQSGGAPWTREDYDGLERTRHLRTFDAGGHLISETKTDTSDTSREVPLFHREITRQDNGAPLFEIFEDSSGTVETEYLYRCAP